MKRILLLSNDINFNLKLNTIYDRSKYSMMLANVEYEDAYKYIINNQCDIVIIHSSYINHSYLIFERLISLKKYIVLYASNSMEVGLVANVYNDPRFYMFKDINCSGLNEILDLMFKNLNIFEKQEKIINEMKEKADDDSLVKRCKLMLMETQGLSESDAYKMIQKRAMVKRISKGQSAKEIISENQ